ncbi:hypothetical protein GBF38_017548 [Nibea albiflora]|uniref:Uncharacterized protein n=1 Tax=Nibea albiflora TaxID=240163 RepID=A0ACB7FJP1_NIBAL|nr:hypothetical protein GBF38_017548 [Nibea albiflora]
MAANDVITWTPEGEHAFVQVKQLLVSSGVLALPDYKKPFIQMCDARSGFMTSVLTQPFGGKFRPIAYYSSKLDPIARAMPQCLQAVQAAALAIQSSAMIVLFHPLTLKVSHAVDALLTQSKIFFMSPARHLNCMTILLSQPHLTIERCTILNPATLLPNETEGTKHDCVGETTEKVLPRVDLTDVVLQNPDIVMFVDGSCKKNPDGTNSSGYAVVTIDKVLKSRTPAPHFSAQAAELIALTEACRSREENNCLY